MSETTIRRVRINSETPKAYKITLGKGSAKRTIWVPKSQVNIIDNKTSDFTGFTSYEMEIPNWLLEKEKK